MSVGDARFEIQPVAALALDDAHFTIVNFPADGFDAPSICFPSHVETRTAPSLVSTCTVALPDTVYVLCHSSACAVRAATSIAVNATGTRKAKERIGMTHLRIV